MKGKKIPRRILVLSDETESVMKSINDFPHIIETYYINKSNHQKAIIHIVTGAFIRTIESYFLDREGNAVRKIIIAQPFQGGKVLHKWVKEYK